MLVINTKKGAVVSVEEKNMGTARNVIERVDRMFDMMFGFGELKHPASESATLVKEAAKEVVKIHHDRHLQAEQAIKDYRSRFFLVRWFIKTPQPYADVTEEQVLNAYREKFNKFYRWLVDKNQNSNFYFGQIEEEITACAELIEALK
jgi:hypothetical protein